MRYHVEVLFLGRTDVEQFRFSPETGEWCAAQRRRRKNARTCSAKARMAFWFVCVMLGVLVAGMRYNANPEQGVVWEKAFACQLGSGPLGGEAAVVLLLAANAVLGFMVAGLCGILANWWGGIGTGIVAIAFALFIEYDVQFGMTESAVLLLGAVAGIGIMLGWMARQEHKRIL